MEELVRLSHASVNIPLTVKWCLLEREYDAILRSLGVIQGASVRVISRGFGSMIIAVGEKRVVLGAELADRILV